MHVKKTAKEEWIWVPRTEKDLPNTYLVTIRSTERFAE